jgi:hypothetical protein
VPLTTATAIRNFFSQIRQPDIGPEAFNQILLSILAGASAFRATGAPSVSDILGAVESQTSPLESL